mmetsp:Transcript_11136/g.28545  ORF Transcript_11136/g.28545 Transcript_11136/m.28545 type:complete len:286 (-) Transcript_11136:422-1279(-)
MHPMAEPAHDKSIPARDICHCLLHGAAALLLLVFVRIIAFHHLNHARREHRHLLVCSRHPHDRLAIGGAKADHHASPSFKLPAEDAHAISLALHGTRCAGYIGEDHGACRHIPRRYTPNNRIAAAAVRRRASELRVDQRLVRAGVARSGGYGGRSDDEARKRADGRPSCTLCASPSRHTPRAADGRRRLELYVHREDESLCGGALTVFFGGGLHEAAALRRAHPCIARRGLDQLGHQRRPLLHGARSLLAVDKASVVLGPLQRIDQGAELEVALQRAALGHAPLR